MTKRAHHRGRRRFLALLALCTLAACGGGAGTTEEPAFDFGPVSGTEISVRTVAVVNPLTEPGRVTAPTVPGVFTVDRSTLPLTLIAAGASVDVDIILAPVASGEIQGQVQVRFTGDGSEQVVPVPLKAEVDDVVIRGPTAPLDFGTAEFGAQVDRTFVIRNESIRSPVTYTGISLPRADLTLVDPPLPFTVLPGDIQVVTLRAAPYATWNAIDAIARLRPSLNLGGVDVQLQMAPGGGRAVLELGTSETTDEETPIITLDVPQGVWALHIAAWRPRRVMPSITWWPTAATADDGAVVPTLFETPGGDNLLDGWLLTYDVFAATLPRPRLEVETIDGPVNTPSPGQYRFRFRVLGADDGTPLRVRAVIKATPNGVPPTTGTLDVNIWVADLLGLTPTTAASDARMQAMLTQADLMLQQIGVRLGTVQYFAFTQTAEGQGPLEESIRNTLRFMPPDVPEYVNLFVYRGPGGSGVRLPGPFSNETGLSCCYAGYDGLNFLRVGLHEILHHLGLGHVERDGLTDTSPGALPRNVMEVDAGTALSPQQGVIVRAQPFVR